MKKTPLKRGDKGLQSKSKLQSKSQLSSSKRMSGASRKKRKRDQNKSAAYKSIDSKRDHRCEGCLSWTRPLSHSHLVPVGVDTSLESDEKNIRLHCISFDGVKGCHEKWEDAIPGEIDKMVDFTENMKIIEEIHPKYYLLKKLSIDGI